MKLRVSVSLLLVVLAASLVDLPATAAEPDEDGCSAEGTVVYDSVERHADGWVLEALSILVPGCEDGEQVGLQVLTEDGDVPPEPLVAGVHEEKASFDLSTYDLAVGPITGLRVFLLGETQVLPLFQITVDRRFFNQPGREQVGLRDVTVLHVEEGTSYEVADAPPGYATIGCDAVGVADDADVIAEGAGTFVATVAGRHLVCYRQEPGPPAPPTEVLGVTLERTAPEIARRVLAATGASALVVAVVGLLLIATGRRLTRFRGRGGSV